MRTFGQVVLSGPDFQVRCEPHVALRLKRVFPNVDATQREWLAMRATAANARDLEWFLERYPMTLTPAAREAVEGGARAYNAQVETAAAILQGRHSMPAPPMLLPPRDYQRQAAALLLSNRGLLLADQLGLGKTVSACTAMADPRTLPAVVVCPVHLTRQWAAEVERFLGLRTHIARSGIPYSIDCDVLVMSYAKLPGWANTLAHARAMRMVVFDECQELRHLGTNRRVAAVRLAETTEFRLGLSATPIYNYGGEFWSVGDVLFPGALGSWREFEREWCTSSYGEKKPKIRDPKAFGTFLRESGLMLRRTRADVARELPSLSRVVQEVHTDAAALDAVEGSALELAQIILSQGKGWEILKAAGEFDARVRQATGLAKAPYVAEFVRMLVESGEPVVLFGWHHAVYRVWAQHLAEFKPVLFTGQESPAAKAKAAKAFVEGDTPVLIMSLRSGSGLDGLQKRSHCAVFGELDWSYGAMEQCVGRVHRDGQADPTMAYYLTATSGCDPVMVDVLGLKRAQLDGALEPGGPLSEVREVDPDHIKQLARDYLARQGKRGREGTQ